MGRDLSAVLDQDVDEQTGEVLDSGRALVRREMVGGLIRPAAPINEVIQLQEDTRRLIQQTLKKGRDYGDVSGGTPSLFKPGAERINAAFAVYPRYRIVEKEIDHDRPVRWMKRKKKWQGRKFVGWEVEEGESQGLYRYVVECELVHRASGVVIGQGIASCSTMESKYVDRPRDSENTVLKMAEKRAHVGTTLNAFGLSDQFTQDIEDNPEAFGRAEPPPREPGDDDVDLALQSRLARIDQLLAERQVTQRNRELIEANNAGQWTADAADRWIVALEKLPMQQPQTEL